MTVSPVSGALSRIAGLTPGRRLARIAVAPAAVVEFCAAFAARRLAHVLELVGARITAIGVAGRQELLDHLAVPRRAGELIDDLAVPADAEPVEPVEDGVDGGLRRALAVGVLDPQQHLAAAAAGIKPVEQRGAGAADMEKTGGRGGKTGDDGHCNPDPRARARLARLRVKDSKPAQAFSAPGLTPRANLSNPGRNRILGLRNRRVARLFRRRHTD